MGEDRFSLREMKMKTKDSRNSIYSLPKKKLQDLCKKYGLSPYKTKPNLVNSLINYFKIADVETSEGNWYNLQDSSGLCDEKGFNQRVHSPPISFPKNAFTSDVKSTHVPSFEFSVSSDDGINLSVDLNSCPSDRFRRLEKECVCNNMQNHKFQSFCQEIQCLRNNRQMTSSFLWETDSDDVVRHTEKTDDAALGFSATKKSRDVSCLNSKRQRTCSPEKLTVLAHLSSETDFSEIEASEIGSHHRHVSYSSSEKDYLKNLVDAAESLRSQLPNSCEDSCRMDKPSSADGGARDSSANGIEASKELPETHLLHGGKKRKRDDFKFDNVHHYNDGRILRSAKRLQSHPRRSLRLVHK
ncbi:uncharacterized protein LOC107824228 isoform X2 [Nicotiana tabacum]|uniref:Uncharacterized protein LOC107824228 isoform X2 n=1 Tax=Nicotiana tabacum TaxID=4097 RepID=A0A1S4CZB3_TOBAC|nr:PREDICTED: uncharacterized protein LOC107824228 isoform X2 [Nicotiana tabacum]XP_018625045.1 uncharacterized protein LOC104092312 isoform X2 [Nicotiana tomentosiformis]